eukprot:TRINITY_DN1909_c0_g1_i1.p1 TRINITY_DN1909_c0_g1~~TRINITY_DN1909_c0_g1_i1.p1  ORF type:complete len:372 (-),score=86.66 TRINITY_DN1909_c0_g1_i1:28-1095(-)
MWGLRGPLEGPRVWKRRLVTPQEGDKPKGKPRVVLTSFRSSALQDKDHAKATPQRKTHSPKPPVVLPYPCINGLNFPESAREAYHQKLTSREASLVGYVEEKSGPFHVRAKTISDQLGLPLCTSKPDTAPYHFILHFHPTKLILKKNQKPPGPVSVDFASGELEYRRKYGKDHRDTPMIKALKINKPVPHTTILDATAGFGTDSFVFAMKGYQVTCLERDPIMYSLLWDGYQNGIQDPEIEYIIKRMKIIHADAFDYIPQLQEEEIPDIIYLDPMYPPKSKLKAALPKKDLSLARAILDSPIDAQELVHFAQKYAKERVILKRPLTEPANPEAIKTCKGNTSRYEVFQGKYEKKH